MNTDNYTPDPVRIAIVHQQAECTYQQAVQSITHLDEYDGKFTARKARRNGESVRYANLNEILPIGISSLIAAGYDEAESTFILQTVFNGFSVQHGGKRMYLPKQDMVLRRFESIQTF